MYKSLKLLFNAPYNRKRKIYAVYRFFFWKGIRILKRTNVQFKFWNNRYIHLDYNSFHAMWLMYNYLPDWEEFNLIKKTLRQGDIVFDIGANIGAYSLWMSKFITPTGKVYSFEPDDINFKRLTQNVEINNLQAIVKVNKTALGNLDGLTNFTVGLDNENHIAIQDEIDVSVTPIAKLDTYVKNNSINSIRYCKIDVEGFEYFVLQGADELLNNKKIDIIQLEINKTLSNADKSEDDLIKFLYKHGYTLCSFDVDHSVLQPITFNRDRENYFAVEDINKINKQMND